MTLTLLRPLPAFIASLAILAPAVPAYAAPSVPAISSDCPSAGGPLAETQRQIDLYAPRVRRSTVSYLRLRLLELHEEGLDRARAVIEHRLNIDDLFRQATPTGQVHSDYLRSSAAKEGAQKAKCRARRTTEP